MTRAAKPAAGWAPSKAVPVVRGLRRIPRWLLSRARLPALSSGHRPPPFEPGVFWPLFFSPSTLSLAASVSLPRTGHPPVAVLSVPDFLIFAEVPAVAVGPEPGRRRYIIWCRCCCRCCPPWQPRGRVLTEPSSYSRCQRAKRGVSRWSVSSNAHAVPTLANAETYSV